MRCQRFFWGVSIVLLLAAALVPLVFSLDAFRAPDEDRWMARTSSFTHKLAAGKLDDLLESTTPGVTLQWVGLPTAHYNSWELRKLPLVLISAGLVLCLGYTFSQLWGRMFGVLAVVFLTSDLFLVGLSRVYGTDALFSLLTVLAFALLLLGRAKHANRYFAAAGAVVAAAILTKISGVFLVPLSLGFLITDVLRKKKKELLVPIIIWCLAGLATAVILLPSLAIHPVNVAKYFLSLSENPDFTQMHQAGPGFYLQTLFFFSAPLPWLVLPAGLLAAILSVNFRRRLPTLAPWLAFAVLFWLEVTITSKKGDRYGLPLFLVLDIVSAYLAYAFWHSFSKKTWTKYPAAALVVAGLCWQGSLLYFYHPHYLAYVNPLTKQFFGSRRYGWGEGLDLAAAYLNAKPDAANLKVATYYPNEFGSKFKGSSLSANQDESGDPDYTIIYRAMFNRGDDAWETDVINRYKNQEPEKIISFGGVGYAWIYKRK